MTTIRKNKQPSSMKTVLKCCSLKNVMFKPCYKTVKTVLYYTIHIVYSIRYIFWWSVFNSDATLAFMKFKGNLLKYSI